MTAPTTPGKGDATAVIRLYRSEDKIQPRAVDGYFARWRWALVVLTQLVFYGLPWLSWGDRPA
ncbi:MAG: cytochrome c oxidase accessory protein CcoG, partial [Roseateles sp.]